jgi:hypothetical protein
MPESHDRQTMEWLHQHLARADIELRDAQHVLDPVSAEESENDLVDDVAAARLAVRSALEKVRAQLGVPGPQRPSEATEQPGRVEPQPAVESTQEPRESSEMHMPEAGGGPPPHDQQRASERPWWRRIFGG